MEDIDHRPTGCGEAGPVEPTPPEASCDQPTGKAGEQTAHGKPQTAAEIASGGGAESRRVVAPAAGSASRGETGAVAIGDSPGKGRLFGSPNDFRRRDRCSIGTPNSASGFKLAGALRGCVASPEGRLVVGLAMVIMLLSVAVLVRWLRAGDGSRAEAETVAGPPRADSPRNPWMDGLTSARLSEVPGQAQDSPPPQVVPSTPTLTNDRSVNPPGQEIHADYEAGNDGAAVQDAIGFHLDSALLGSPSTSGPSQGGEALPLVAPSVPSEKISGWVSDPFGGSFDFRTEGGRRAQESIGSSAPGAEDGSAPREVPRETVGRKLPEDIGNQVANLNDQEAVGGRAEGQSSWIARTAGQGSLPPHESGSLEGASGSQGVERGPRATELDESAWLTYITQPGDTAFSLARRFFGNPSSWPILVEANPQVFVDPASLEAIAPGQKLKIPRPVTSAETPASKALAQ